MVYVQQVEEEKLSDGKEYRNKKYKTKNEFDQHKGGSSRPQFQKQKGHHHHLGKYNGKNLHYIMARTVLSQGSVLEGGS